MVTGGAGYIGAHVVRLLEARGDSVVIVDDLVSGDRTRIGTAPLIQFDLASDAAVDALTRGLGEHEVDAVIHLAARKQVGESVERPAWYFQQNIASLANVLMAMDGAAVQRLVFSSSAAVYASADRALTESDPTAPVNPYGDTKLIGERLIASAAVAAGIAGKSLRASSLRYFNVAGAGSPELGDNSASNLVPMVFERLDAGEPPQIFGDDYETADGTCVRDYVHVLDVAEAHLATLDALDRLGHGHHVFNIGTGVGLSVREMITAILRVAGSPLGAEVVGRRLGDAPAVVASIDKIREAVGWHSRLGLSDIVESAWESHRVLTRTH